MAKTPIERIMTEDEKDEALKQLFLRIKPEEIDFELSTSGTTKSGEQAVTKITEREIEVAADAIRRALSSRGISSDVSHSDARELAKAALESAARARTETK